MLRTEPVDGSPATSDNFLRNSQGGGKACASLSPGSAQKRVDAACAAGEDCGMTGVLALLSAAALGTLPALPARGLARETRAGVRLQTLAGRPLATVPGLDLAPDKERAHGLVMRDRRGRLFVLDRETRRVRRVYELPSRVPGCRLTDARGGFDLLVCG